MKKTIFILGLSLILSGCGNHKVKKDEIIIPDRANTIVDTNEKDIPTEEEIKEVILQINALREKYRNSMNEEQYEYGSPCINLESSNKKEFRFDNEMFEDKDYFKNLVLVLDEGVAQGLKEHVEVMETEEIEENMIILRKIGKVIIYTEKRNTICHNYISIKVNLSDDEDEDHSNIFDKILSI